MNDHKLAPPLPAFPVGDVSGKMWPTLIATQQAGIYPKSSPLSALVLSRQYIATSRYVCTAHAPIYWGFVYKVLIHFAALQYHYNKPSEWFKLPLKPYADIQQTGWLVITPPTQGS